MNKPPGFNLRGGKPPRWQAPKSRKETPNKEDSGKQDPHKSADPKGTQAKTQAKQTPAAKTKPNAQAKAPPNSEPIKSPQTDAEPKPEVPITIETVVHLELQIFDENGEPHPTSFDEDMPIEVIIGMHKIPLGLEMALCGKAIGDTLDLVLSPDEAYGAFRPELRDYIPRKDLPFKTNPLLPDLDPHAPLQVGEILAIHTQEGHMLPGTIEAIEKERILINLNHPLAGQEIRIIAKVLNTRWAQEIELQTGTVLPDEVLARHPDEEQD